MTITLNGTTGITTPALTNSGALTQTGAATLSSTLQAATTIGVGGATPAASGAGITFPATLNASTDANTLDDYEEGTFTPAINGTGGAPTVSYTSRYGFYTKIGRMVYISTRVQVSTISGGSGGLQITGLPFSADNTSSLQHNLGGTFSDGVNWGTSRTQLSPVVFGNTSYVAFRGLQNNGSNSDLQISDLSNGDYLDAQGWYFV